MLKFSTGSKFNVTPETHLTPHVDCFPARDVNPVKR